jgi:Tfp pilus assembly protein PilO
MTLFEQAARKRYALERLAKLKHNTNFDVDEPQNKNTLLIIALIVAVVYGFGIDFYYSTKYSQAQHGEILAKSELTDKEVKALNIMPVKSERHAVR